MNMPILTQFQQAIQTISSREIANLTQKRHSDVKRDFEVMSAQLNLDVRKFAHIYFDSVNRQQTEYLLDKKTSLCLVSGYSAQLRMAIIDRWEQLENRELSKMEILQMALESEQQKIALQAQLEIQAPKVAFVDKYVAGNGNKTFRQVAKLLQIKENAFRDFLESNRIMYKLNGEWTAYQNHVDAKRFFVKTGVSESGHAFNHALFTPKGVEWIAGELAKSKVREVAA